MNKARFVQIVLLAAVVCAVIIAQGTFGQTVLAEPPTSSSMASRSLHWDETYPFQQYVVVASSEDVQSHQPPAEPVA